MKMPVVIAAHNEQEMIGRTLDHLDAKLFEPVVVTNGCKDSTADVARDFGATVIELKEKGKLPALQEGLRSLGERALEPVFFTDADSYPVSSRSWQRIMLDSYDESRPQVVCGPVAHIDGRFIDDFARSLKRQIEVRKAKREKDARSFGANMVINFQDEIVLKEILELPHVWPGEDRLIKETIVDAGGEAIQITDARATILASARYLHPVSHTLKLGAEEARKEVLGSYMDRAAKGSISYDEYVRKRNRRQKRPL